MAVQNNIIPLSIFVENQGSETKDFIFVMVNRRKKMMKTNKVLTREEKRWNFLRDMTWPTEPFLIVLYYMLFCVSHTVSTKHASFQFSFLNC